MLPLLSLEISITGVLQKLEAGNPPYEEGLMFSLCYHVLRRTVSVIGLLSVQHLKN